MLLRPFTAPGLSPVAPPTWHTAIDWTSAQTAGLLDLIVPTPWGMQDLCALAMGVRNGAGPPALMGPGGGLEQEFVSTSDNQFLFSALSSIDNTGPWSFCWVSVLTSFSVIAPHIAIFPSTPGNTRFGYQSGYFYLNTEAIRKRWDFPDGVVVLNQPHRGVITHDGAGTYRTWINGNACPALGDGTPSMSASATRIGGTSDSTTRWNGTISEVRRYDRELAEDEALAFADEHYGRKIFLDLERAPQFFLPAMRAEGAAVSSGSAALTTTYQLAGVGIALAGGTASLTGSVSLSAAGASFSSGSAGVTALVSISAAGLAEAAGQAGLSSGTFLAAAGSAQASGNAALAARLEALAAGAAESSGSANLLATLVFSASGGALASGSADLQSVVAISADGFVEAMGAGTLWLRVDLAAAGAAEASGSAGIGLLLGAVLIPDARYVARLARRAYRVALPTP